MIINSLKAPAGLVNLLANYTESVLTEHNAHRLERLFEGSAGDTLKNEFFANQCNYTSSLDAVPGDIYRQYSPRIIREFLI